VTVLLTGLLIGFTGKIGTLGLIVCYLFCLGFISPNAMALALQPFTRNVGSASALIGSLQMVAGASASGLVSYLHNGTAIPMVSVMAGCAGISLMVLFPNLTYRGGTVVGGLTGAGASRILKKRGCSR
jgi:DHA1 family bicyclomycin/chloramphenicol resistance-like MFS transporter